jgi:hypothetical protein
VTFKAVPDTDQPAETARARTSQIKTIKDRFSGRLGGADEKQGAETRTIPKAIFEYADPQTKLPLGAIFGMNSTGTNPDVLLLIEARNDDSGKLRWHYAHARRTDASVRLHLANVQVCSQPAVNNGTFETWAYYFLRRDFK